MYNVNYISYDSLMVGVLDLVSVLNKCYLSLIIGWYYWVGFLVWVRNFIFIIFVFVLTYMSIVYDVDIIW